ncbi:MAG: hypothetical protein ACE5PO_03195 [Candidatus Bathyarchaeia archaeon]
MPVETVTVQFLLSHLAVGTVWIAIGVALLIVTVNIKRFLSNFQIKRRVFKGILLLGYIVIISAVLHFVEEYLLIQGEESAALSVGLASHVSITALAFVVLYSFYQYWQTIKKAARLE